MFKGTSFGLWRIPISLEKGKTVGAPEKVEGTGATPIRYISISADGKKIAYSTVSLNSNIWQLAVSPTTGEAEGPPAPLYEDTSQRKTNPVFSPDGKWIAFGVWRLGSANNVWLVDAEGRNPTPLTTDKSGSGVPSWMPDGERITYVTMRQNRPMLWTKNFKTGEETPFLELDVQGGIPHLSPDGKQIAYNSRKQGGSINVWTQPVDGGPPRQLTFDGEMMAFPCWSPDGKWLAFEVKRSDDNHILVMPSEGGRPIQLTDEPGLSWPNSFSPDGDKIAFAGMREGVWNLYWVSRKNKEQKRLTNFSKLNAYVRYPAWSPLGDRIVFEHAETTGNVWLMELK
jgi:Tol biopolymer transport system component